MRRVHWTSMAAHGRARQRESDLGGTLLSASATVEALAASNRAGTAP